MLETLPRLPNAHLPKFLNTLTPLCTSHPNLFSQHLSALLVFLPGLILPSADPGPTPTVARPFPTPHFSFSFPPVLTQDDGNREDEADEEKEEVRKAALEFMITLSEAKASMVRKQDGWIPAIVRGCLEGMGEFPDDQASLNAWLEAEVSSFFVTLASSDDISLRKIRLTILILMYTSNHSIGWLVPSGGSMYYRQRFSIFRRCW
jgi:importin-5